MICDWCGHGIVDYATHLSEPAAAGCRTAARRASFVTHLDDPAVSRDRIRRQALRDLSRNRRRDRLEEPGLATYARADRQARI